MGDLLQLILAFFGWLYFADRRPEARQLTVGCALVVLGVLAIFMAVIAYQRW